MYTIKEIAEIVGENEHTIRYYAKLGLFPKVKRDRNNIRVFSDDDIDDVRMVIMLADTGMPLESIKDYVDLATAEDGESRQLEMLQRHQNEARSRMVRLQKEIQLLDWKVYQLQEKNRK